MVGAGLTDPRAWLELIADGHHVHPWSHAAMLLLREGSYGADYRCHAGGGYA